MKPSLKQFSTESRRCRSTPYRFPLEEAAEPGKLRSSGGSMTKPIPALMLMALSIVLLFPAFVSGPFTQPSPPSRTRPNQLPLSGDTSGGSVTTGQATAPAASSTSVNTLNSTIRVDGAFQGSTPVGVATKETLLLSLDDAIKRGL